MFWIIYPLLISVFMIALLKKCCKISKTHPFKNKIIILLDERQIQIAGFIALIFLIAIIWIANRGPDYANYELMYFRYRNGNAGAYKDFGFQMLVILSNSIGLTFEQFRIVYLTIAMFIIFYAVVIIRTNSFLILGLYFIYPFLLNIVQIRNFMVHALLTLAVALCFKGERRIKKYIIWMGFTFLAGSQHAIAFLYIPLMFFYYHKKIRNFILMICGLGSLVFAVNKRLLANIINVCITFLNPSTRINEYGVIASKYGFLLSWFQAALMIVLTYLMYDLLRNVYCPDVIKNDFKQELEKDIAYLEYTANLMLCGVMYFPLYIINGNYTRLMQNFSIVFYIIFAMLWKYRKIFYARNQREKWVILFVFMTLFIYNASTIWIELYELVVKPVFHMVS